ncbi:TRAP transporter small permease [Chelativorans sp. M5D2P16]|uniref:TRAP transporter small permease n=1 Tax=Chelativorans sp. M5D2P16 TaxID=3095678 RepID=UPI002ACABC41|nr:TRAP transporter small permease [Chelativorans sp. M5D2P16]MDZ5699836.1 TRAP transporter small permease [Chelativorans sp. M5D2P16]
MTLLDWSGRLIAAACLGVMFVALFVNVVLRYAFGSGIAWAYEIHALLLPWLVAGGIVIAAARGRNIAITLLPDLLSASGRRVLTLLIHLVIVLIATSVLWSSQPILKAAQFQTLSTLGIKQIWGYASLVFAFGAMSVIGVVEIVRLLAGGDPDPLDLERQSLG